MGTALHQHRNKVLLSNSPWGKTINYPSTPVTLFFVIMSKSVILSLLAQGNTGNEILSILDALVADNVSGFDYIESPLIESALGIPTLGEVAL